MIHTHSLQSYIFEQKSLFQYMESTLIVKNFGPIKSVELKLRNVNVFIGPQSTGKSALAKIYTIFKAPRKFFYKENEDFIVDDVKATEEITDAFNQYNINSFIKPDTEIEFVSELHKVTYKGGLLKYEPKLLNEIKDLENLIKEFDKNRIEIISKFSKLDQKFIFFKIRANKLLLGSTTSVQDNQWEINLKEDNCESLLKMLKPIEDDSSTSASIYIPAERNFINIIRKYALSLALNEVPIPKHILTFGAELEKQGIQEIDLNFVQKGLKYKVVDGEERIYINDSESIMLGEAASGIQSIVPLLASVTKVVLAKHRSYVIEEPELNLFPLAQYELIKFLESNRVDAHTIWQDFGSIHTYTTHSPYILSSLNNLLYGHKVFKTLNSKVNTGIEGWETVYDANKEKVQNIVKAIINPESFTAYQIIDGYAQSIFNEETGLIADNYIDMVSDKVDDDFNELMDLLK